MQGGCHPEEEPEKQVFLHYALTGMLICGKCGQEYRRVTWARNGKESGLEMQQSLTNGVKKWNPRHRRERIKQGGDGSHPQDHK